MPNAITTAAPAPSFCVEAMRSVTAFAATALSLCALAPAAHATIVANPASIVCAATYCTDTVNNLEWYKFSNAATTIGLTYNQVLSTLLPTLDAGWGVASIAQVHSLWAQYGYTADSGDNGINANYGLTAALVDDLGVVQFSPFINARNIYAATSDPWPSDSSQQTLTLVGDDEANGHHDEVKSYWRGLGRDDFLVGLPEYTATWLVRAVPEATQVPEPATLSLVGLAIVGLLAGRSKRKDR